MWTYEKKLQYPVNIKTPNPRLAKFIISQLGGPDGELAASLGYIHHRDGMKNNQVKGIFDRHCNRRTGTCGNGIGDFIPADP